MSLLYLIDDKPADLTDYFAKVAHLPYAMLLDSAASQHPNSRYHILVCEPVATLSCEGTNCQISIGEHTEQCKADPFVVIAELLQRLLPAIDPKQCPLPFCGGVLGYFGYDLARVLENLPTQAVNDIALPDLAVGFYPWALVLDKNTQQLWCVDSLGQAAARWLQVQQLFETAPITAPFRLQSDWQSNMSRQDYQQKIADIHAYLKSGDCYQINLAQRFSARCDGDAYQAYLALRQQNKAPFSAFIRLPQGAVLSISPERFIEIKGRQIETKPIKGTLPRLEDPELDREQALRLQQSPKDRAENVMIVDLLRNDLGKVASAGSVQVPSLFAIESFPAVHHLVSTVCAELAPTFQPLDALKAAFPGGSITGAPKVRAMQIIEALEPHRRSVYCGAIGYLSQHGHMDTNIAIRTLVTDGQTIHCWAGGGIIADSDANSEYQETFDKVARILPVLAAL